MKELICVLACWLVLTTPVAAQLFGEPQELDRFGYEVAAGDFDGDGFEDLAAGSREIIVLDGGYYSGQVNVVYGSADGLDPRRQQLWNRQTMGIHPLDYSNDLGYALAAGDFDNDGYDDLAIGAPTWTEFFHPNGISGIVHILYGSAEGLRNDRLQSWYPNREDLDIFPTGNDAMGSELSVGNFDGDDYDDLAIGIPNLQVDEFEQAGAILVLYGDADGLSSERHRVLEQPPSPPAFENGDDRFGRVLASGDINGDGFDELAVGIPDKDQGDEVNTGAVGVFFGSRNGLTLLGYDLIVQDDPMIPAGSDPGDSFGFSLTVTDFGDDGFAELVAGAPFENLGDDDTNAEGAFVFLFGGPNGVRRDNGCVCTVGGMPLMGGQAANDFFAYSLATGDFDGDGDQDLTIGEPGHENLGGLHILLANLGSISVVGNTFWTRDTEGVPGESTGSFGGNFGQVLATGDFDGDGFSDLAIGDPNDTVGNAERAGTVTILFGSESGLTADGSQYLHQNLPPSGTIEVIAGGGGPIVVGGLDDPVDSQTPLIVVWTPATDPEMLPIEYWWQISSNPEFSDTLDTIAAGTVNQLSTSLGYLGGLMRANGVEHEATVTWYHRVIASDGVAYIVSPVFPMELTLGAFVANESDNPDGPDQAELLGSYPNPFTTSATIRYRTSSPGMVHVDLFDLRGQLIRSLTSFSPSGAVESIVLERAGLASGVYFYTVRGAGLADEGTLVVVD